MNLNELAPPNFTEYPSLVHNKEYVCWKNMLSFRDYINRLKRNNTLKQNMKYAVQKVFIISA